MPIQPIRGNLRMPAGGGDVLAAGPDGIAPAYRNAYNSALAMNQQNYNNILAGYQQVMGQQMTAADAIANGYTQLGAEIQQGLAGSDTAARQEVEDQYQAASGKATQSAIQRGLGNTTITNSLQRGVEADKAKRLNEIRNQMQQLMVKYKSEMDGMSLKTRELANQQYSALAKSQLDWMNSISAPYPNAEMYQKLAQAFGRGQQARQNQAMMMPRMQQQPGRMQQPVRMMMPPQQGGGRKILDPGRNFDPNDPDGELKRQIAQAQEIERLKRIRGGGGGAVGGQPEPANFFGGGFNKANPGDVKGGPGIRGGDTTNNAWYNYYYGGSPATGPTPTSGTSSWTTPPASGSLYLTPPPPMPTMPDMPTGSGGYGDPGSMGMLIPYDPFSGGGMDYVDPNYYAMGSGGYGDMGAMDYSFMPDYYSQPQTMYQPEMKLEDTYLEYGSGGYGDYA